MTSLLKIATDGFYRLIEVILVICMAVMLVMVFGNVMLRIFFNTGIDLSEEMLIRARRRAGALGLESVELHVMNDEATPFADAMLPAWDDPPGWASPTVESQGFAKTGTAPALRLTSCASASRR